MFIFLYIDLDLNIYMFSPTLKCSISTKGYFYEALS